MDSIHEAAARIGGISFRTPTYPSFSEDNIWFKFESFQPVRSFKIRGASNKILSLPEQEKKRGVITASSGNHGLAVAYIAAKLGIRATIVLPETVIPDKLEMIRGLGAEVVLFGKQQDERSAKADEIARGTGQIFVQPFNDLRIIEGQATCGLEISEDMPSLSCVFVPIGGGGLISGVGCALKLDKRTRETKVVGVQPEGSPSMYSSWRKGQVTSIDASNTIADGLAVRRPGDITFAFVRRFVDDIVLVSDDEIMSASYILMRREHVLAEPSGAAAFAAAVRAKREGDLSADSVVIVSGGNISQKVLSRIIANYGQGEEN